MLNHLSLFDSPLKPIVASSYLAIETTQEHSNNTPPQLQSTHLTTTLNTLEITITNDEDFDHEAIKQYIAYTLKKKYKPVAKKIKSVICELPDKFHIIQNITGNPLKDLPVLNTHPPPFTPTGWYTEEQKDLFNKLNPGFLLLVEPELLHHFMMVYQDTFAWKTSECGHFKEEYFPPIKITVVSHTPWVHHNTFIPLGLHAEVY